MRPLSRAQLPIWHAEVLHRHTPRWTQMTVLRLTGPINATWLERAINAVVARHSALRTRLQLRSRQAWLTFAPVTNVELFQLQRSTALCDREAAIQDFLNEAARHRFPLYGASLFRADLLHLGDCDFVLTLRLHHIAADGIALALLVPQIAAEYSNPKDRSEPDLSYERWLDRQARQTSVPDFAAAVDFYQRELAGAMAHHPTLYDKPVSQTSRDPPDLAEAMCFIGSDICSGLQALARAKGATLFIVLFAAYAAVIRSVVNSPDLLVTTFVSGRAGEAEPLVGTCINMVPVRVQLGAANASAELIAAVKAAWRPVRQYHAVPMGALSSALQGQLPLTQFAINYLDMREAAFEVPGITAQVTHAQQGFPLHDLLFYALREQDGRLRLRLIVGSGTTRISPSRLTCMMGDLVELLTSWTSLPQVHGLAQGQEDAVSRNADK